MLDTRADIFMNLDGAIDEIELPANNDEIYVHNTWTDSVPTVIQGFGSGKVDTSACVNIHFGRISRKV